MIEVHIQIGIQRKGQQINVHSGEDRDNAHLGHCLDRDAGISADNAIRIRQITGDDFEDGMAVDFIQNGIDPQSVFVFRKLAGDMHMVEACIHRFLYIYIQAEQAAERRSSIDGDCIVAFAAINGIDAVELFARILLQTNLDIFGNASHNSAAVVQFHAAGDIQFVRAVAQIHIQLSLAQIHIQGEGGNEVAGAQIDLLQRFRNRFASGIAGLDANQAAGIDIEIAAVVDLHIGLVIALARFDIDFGCTGIGDLAYSSVDFVLYAGNNLVHHFRSAVAFNHAARNSSRQIHYAVNAGFDLFGDASAIAIAAIISNFTLPPSNVDRSVFCNLQIYCVVSIAGIHSDIPYVLS